MTDNTVDPDPMPVFTLLGKDKLAGQTVVYYRNLCRFYGKHEQAEEVSKAIDEFAAWQLRNPDKMKYADHKHVPATEQQT